MNRRVLEAMLWMAMGLIVLTVFANLTGCAKLVPQPGNACNEGDAVCHGSTGAMVCVGGKYVATTCGGPDGCKRESDTTVVCDQTAGAKPGEPCVAAFLNQAECTGEGGGYVRCVEGVWREGRCAGGVCRPAAANVACQ